MDKHIEMALVNRQKGYNCAQAVVCAYANETGISEKDGYRLSEGLGSGLAGCQLTCGALLGMALVISLLNSSGELNDKSTRFVTYRLIQEGLKQFKELNQSTQCAELKGITTHQVLRSCEGCIEDSVKIIETLRKQII